MRHFRNVIIFAVILPFLRDRDIILVLKSVQTMSEALEKVNLEVKKNLIYCIYTHCIYIYVK